MYLKKRSISLFVIFISFVSIVGAAIFQDVNTSDFSQGNFYRTFYNVSGFVQLNNSQGFSYGNFSSRIFNAGANSSWSNISWFTELCYGCEIPNGSLVEQGDFLRPANTTGLVLLAHMNEGGGNIKDFSGYGNNGTPFQFEGTEYNASGKFETSLDFENSGGIGPGELVDFGSPAQYDFTNQLTLEAWINPETFAGSPTIIDKDPAVFSMYLTSFPRVRVDAGASTITGTHSLIANNWYHVVFTYNGSQMRLYTNGALDGNPVAKTGNLNTNSKDLEVGSGWNGATANAFPFDGKIDEVSVYNRSLNSEEIRDHYLRGVLRLNLSVRSCDDPSCAGEQFTQLYGNSQQTISVIENQYFQYFAELTSENTTHSPYLYNVSIGYLATNSAPLVNVTYPFNNTNYSLVQTHLNYTAIDPDLQACWYTTDLGVTNLTVTCGSNVTGLSSSEGTNVWRVYANDTSGIERQSSVQFFVDSLPPILDIVSPSNNSVLSNTTIFVNYTFYDSGIGVQGCWWTNSSGVRNNTISCGSNFSFVGQEGNNLVTVYANDTLGNTNSSTYLLVANTRAPSVSIIVPAEGAVVGSTTNIELNYSAVDPTRQACWYSVDEIIQNTTISSCLNTTFSLPGQGVFTIRVYANDTLGNVGSDFNTLIVSADAPSITPLSPVNSYLGLASSQNVSFTYLPTDLDLQSCNLWSNISGTYSLNSTHLSAISGQQNNFYLNLSNLNDGAYSWALECNDTLGHSAITGNQTFYIDKTVPGAGIVSPSGSFSSLTNIPISVSYSDASPVRCFYNVTFAATGNLVIGNSELSNCADTTFTVDTESSYFFTLAVNDSAGNVNVSRKTFTVSIPSSPNGGGGGGGSSSSGGGGGGSSAAAIRSSFKVEIEDLEKLVIGRGESESVELKVANRGTKFLNNCRLSSTGGIADWISGQEVKSLSPGQEDSYVLSISSPINIDLGNYFATITLSCDETSASFSYNVEVTGGDFELSILSSERLGTKLRVNYALENFGEVSKDLIVSYRLYDEKENLMTEGSLEKLNVAGKERIETRTDFELPKNSVGDFKLVMEVTDGIRTQNYEQAVRLTSGSISGFAISDTNLRAVSWFGILILFGFGIFLVIKMLRQELLRKKGLVDSGRQFITIDLKS